MRWSQGGRRGGGDPLCYTPHQGAPLTPQSSSQGPVPGQDMGKCSSSQHDPTRQAEELRDGSPWRNKQTSMSRIQSHPRAVLVSLVSLMPLVSLMFSIPLPKGSQSRMWPAFPLFNPTSSGWKPSKHYFFVCHRYESLSFHSYSLRAICSEHFQNDGN